MTLELGLIEGFFGAPWPWDARARTIAFLAPHGYRFFIYAPKGDPYLRRRWREPHPLDWAARLVDLALHCRSLGVRFGVGLSPYELHAQFDEAGRKALAQKLELLGELGVFDLAVLFDDMRGDVPELAARQVEIMHWIAAHARHQRLLMCPTYYSDDPVLDRAFGRRPQRYLENLGRTLDPSIAVLWTGEEVCSRAISVGHVRRVAEQLGRKPFLWDNYPVNDGPRMSGYLHLRGFTGRSATLAPYITAHGINPMLQPTLTCIPALTLAESYRLHDDYEYGAALHRATALVLGDELGAKVCEDLLTLNDVGLERLTNEMRQELQQRYGELAHPAAKEITAWLAGVYGATDELVRTQ